MANIFCDNCGASIEDTAKFCRQCGRATDVSEATTRTLDAPREVETETRPYNSSPTAPSYMPSATYSPMPAPKTYPFDQQRSQKKTVFVLAGLIMVLLIALGVAVAFITFDGPDDPGDFTSTGIPVPAAPPPPRPPGHPEPPHPPPLPGRDNAKPVDSSLIYPGSEVTMNMTQSDGEGVTQMRTTDPVSKVADWYEEKLDMTKRLTVPGGAVILRGAKGTVIITGEGNETSIVIKHEANQ